MLVASIFKILVFLPVVFGSATASSQTGILEQDGNACFFTLPGQGAFNIIGVRNNGKNIVFIFDAGIAAATSHAKLEHFKDPFPSTLFLVKQDLPAPDPDAAVSSPQRLPATFATASSPSPQQPRQNAAALQAIKPSLQRPEMQTRLSLGDLIQNIFRSLEPDLIFVFLSHPDKDHINLVNQLPDQIPAVFFLCGDWLSNPDNTQEVRTAINYIQTRQNRLLYMPYYWRTNPIPQRSADSQPITQLESAILNPSTRDIFGAWVWTQNQVVCNVGLGTLLQSLPPFNQDTDERQPQWLDLVREAGNFLNNVHVWLLNHHRSDMNAQSCVVSCTLPQQNMSFVFTGDADDSTFSELAYRLGQGRIPANFLRNGNSNHLIWLSLPHHGSGENTSTTMMELFQPDAYIVTAGTGAQYGHPGAGVIQSLRQGRQNFWQQYQVAGREPFQFFKFQSTSERGPDQRFVPSIHRVGQYETPVFCPNKVGCLRMDTAGHLYHQSPIESIVEYESGKSARYDLTSHLYEIPSGSGLNVTARNVKTGGRQNCLVKTHYGQRFLYCPRNAVDPCAVLIRPGSSGDEYGYELTPV